MRYIPFFILILLVGSLQCKLDRVQDFVPAASISIAPENHNGVNDYIQFYSNAESFATSYFWEFGDGDTSSLELPLKAYTKGGTYTVALTIDANWGKSYTVTKDIFIDPFKNKMVPLTGGTFTMGCNPAIDGNCDADSEYPRHEVTVSDFSMGRTEVTQGEWEAVMGNNPSFYSGCAICPVESVSWTDIQTFLDTLNRLSGYTYYLPSEAQWEYAARAGDTTVVYAGSNFLDSVGWFENPTGNPEIVASKTPNAWGLYDMSGNVSELCADDFHSNFDGAPTDGSAWIDAPNPTGDCSMRGGSFTDFEGDCRVSARFGFGKIEPAGFVGFRLAWSP